MVRPVCLQFLSKGKFLSGLIFPLFVDTWNWLVNAFDTMCGDRDLNAQEGCIWVDRTDPQRPVIRLDKSRLNSESEDVGRFGIEEGKYKNMYYNVGGKSYEVEDEQEVSQSSGIDALKIDITGSSPSATIEHYANLSALKQAQNNKNYYIMPLYTINNGVIKCDWRVGPDAAQWEF